jgi:hypothetical protein
MTQPLSIGPAIGVGLVGAAASVMATIWLRARTLAGFERALGSRQRSEWAYFLLAWLIAAIIGVGYAALGLIPARLDIGITAGATLVALGVVWPPYMQDPAFTRIQLLIQRGMAIVIGVILLALATDYHG